MSIQLNQLGIPDDEGRQFQSFIRLYSKGKVIVQEGDEGDPCIFLLRFVGHQVTGTLARWVELAAMAWLATLFLTATCLLVVDLVTCIGLALRRWTPGRGSVQITQA